MNARIDFAIVTPLEEERRAMLARLPGAQRLSGERGDPRVYCSARVPVFRGGKEGCYTVIVTDLLAMGRVEAAIAVKDLIRRWSPRYIILTGIAGGFSRAGVHVGDVLVADQIVDFEQQELRDDGAHFRWSVHRVDPCLLAAAKQLGPDHWQSGLRRPEPGESRRHIGPICTGDKVVADGSLDRLAEAWPKLIGVEMEAGGAASAAYQAVPAPGFLMVRGVSDLADAGKTAAHTNGWRAYACEVAAGFVAALLGSAPVPFDGSSPDTAGKRPEPALRCPRCRRQTLHVLSRSGNEFTLSCKHCSALGLLSRNGSEITSLVVPGIIAVVGVAAVAEFLKSGVLQEVFDSFLDFLDYVPDLM